MKFLTSAATGFVLLATGATAQSLTDTETVTLNATVGEYLAITDHTDSIIGDLDISAGSEVAANNNVSATENGKATFEVTANVAYNIALNWKTWGATDTPALPAGAPAGVVQAYYYNAATDVQCAFGGTVSFDPDPFTASADDVQRGVNGAPFSPTPGGSLTAFPRGIATYGLNTEAAPNITDCDDGVAAPGIYSLDVEVTVSKS
ncbi:hypothetical protein [Jannaschia seohaensis]|uniref:Uncharacterized protein n=1 Tax=Jannaschia seohaensis TaxID=475081 RepID=A0A2Y9ADM3_9RHOB|nr:hypothetical protein [Jannaschia seohaensis]PWJ21410.1 hypothetical protein BCF38_102663 [Jannaschia seohaensis]SSA42016.1 hypothetical protein SAMN05421539_102663 [Jannaschia seohaensis]